MGAGHVQVFKAGDDTVIVARVENERCSHRILKTGGGEFADRQFDSVEEAQQFALQRLATEPTAYYYVLEDGVVVATVLNPELPKWQMRKPLPS